ncbi:MAG TPA: hypothetical protein VNW73_08055 [Ktedonobacteraceae bacterium]|nr:hypothetical protein [Ktedonobacteraceae bacterium]
MLLRVAWLTLVILTLGIFFASLSVYSAQLQTPCAGASCWYTQLSAGQVEALKGIGLSPGVYAAYTVALTLASVVLCLVVSTLIFWRRSDDRMALLVALLLVVFGPIYATSSIVAVPSPWRVPNECLYFLALILLMLVFLLFPSGQFVPHWMRWVFLVFLIGLVPTAFVAPAFPPYAPVGQLTFLESLSELATIAIVQIYRYRRVSSPLQRQQTKWVVFGIAASITVVVIGSVPLLIFPTLAEPGSLYPVALNAFSTLGPLFIPLSFGFAMLHSRLWDIDVLINRTLVYGTLTVILAVIYVGLVIGLQALLRSIISQDNSVAIVISTLAIAALFQPLRHRIQAIIDRRFYRRKYDAAKTLEAFSATLRNEVDLDQLREHLLAVVQETMQPEHVSLWLRKAEQRRQPNADR